MPFVTIDKAIARGSLMVNLPVLALLFAPAALMIWGEHAVASLVGAHRYSIALGSTCFLSFVAAWLWWSISIPKWRLWAYERVEDIPELNRRAIEAKLIWPDGSVFSRTEIKSAAHAKRERELEKIALGREIA